MITNTIKLGLERMQKLLQSLGNPHLKVPIIHVAGTNGKGSVCAFETEILRNSGYRVGRFTSPFLLDPTDSINLDGRNIDHETFEQAQLDIQNLAAQKQLHISSFEILTAIAFELFARPQFKLDLAVIEVGLGGQRDSTNVCDSSNTLISCITPISIDHQAFLGTSVSEIAAQKAGIAKPQVPVLLAEQSYPEVEAVVRQAGRAKSCDVFLVRPYKFPQLSRGQLDPLPLVPSPNHDLNSIRYDRLQSLPHSSRTIPNVLSSNASFQHQNAATAVTLAHLLRTHPHPLKLMPSLSDKITDVAIVEGLRKTHWQGRLDFTRYQSSELLLDGAHNQASAKALGDYISSIKRPITIIMALSSPRDPREFIKALEPERFVCAPQLITTSFSAPENMDWVKAVCPETMAKQISDCAQCTVEAVVRPVEALKHAISIARDSNELIVVCGSLYLVSDVLRLINEC